MIEETNSVAEETNSDKGKIDLEKEDLNSEVTLNINEKKEDGIQTTDVSLAAIVAFLE